MVLMLEKLIWQHRWRAHTLLCSFKGGMTLIGRQSGENKVAYNFSFALLILKKKRKFFFDKSREYKVFNVIIPTPISQINPVISQFKT
jgi:hypothetical protein